MSGSRLTTLDASFLELESSSAHMHVGWAARFAPRPGHPAPRFDELREHVAGRMGRAPRYRQKLARVPLSLHDPVWVDDDDFDVDRHVRHCDSGDLGMLVDEVMSEQLGRDRPLWELWIADDLPDGGIGVIGKAHHAMVDGIAAVELASLLVDLTPEPDPPEPDGWLPARAPDAVSLVADGAHDRAGQLAGLARWPLELTRHPRRLAALAGEAAAERPRARRLAALRDSAHLPERADLLAPPPGAGAPAAGGPEADQERLRGHGQRRRARLGRRRRCASSSRSAATSPFRSRRWCR